MNRKIAALFAADVAGFSTLVADDEEDALRRLKAYRAVIDDFIGQFGGTIFNTAGDSVMASFPSAVDAVRCSIDIQESLRTRNRAYPETRHMMFRIGINIGDVVERDGDLLGDGVNLAARLQALAEPGGVCISRSVHEQVVGKLSVGFDDMGEQVVKNIPTPVHAYGVAWRDEAPVRSRRRRAHTSWIATGVALGLVAAVSGYVVLRGRAKVAAISPVLETAKIEPAKAAASVTPPAASPSPPARRPFVAEAVPFLTNLEQKTLADVYVPASGYKAIALNKTRHGFVIGAADEEAAKTLALQRCEVRAKAASSTTACELYAVGDLLVWPHAQPPLPPQPWLRADASTAQPLAYDLIKRLRPTIGERLVKDHLTSPAKRYIALNPLPRRGASEFYKGTFIGEQEAMRIVLELCSAKINEPCIVAAIGSDIVVPVPMTMSAVGLFRAATHPLISNEHREPLERRLAAASTGWNAIAVGTSGQPDAALGQPTEERATTLALAGCTRRERDCKIIAIGPFLVEPNAVGLSMPDAPKPAAQKAEPGGKQQRTQDAPTPSSDQPSTSTPQPSLPEAWRPTESDAPPVNRNKATP